MSGKTVEDVDSIMPADSRSEIAFDVADSLKMSRRDTAGRANTRELLTHKQVLL